MIKVRGHRLLVKEDPVEKVSKGGIVLAVDEKLERSGVQTGLVVQQGEGCYKAYRTIDGDGIERNGQPWTKPGDYVIFARHAGRFIKDPVTEEEFLIMNDEDILGVLEDGNNPTPNNSVREKVVTEIEE